MSVNADAPTSDILNNALEFARLSNSFITNNAVIDIESAHPNANQNINMSDELHLDNISQRSSDDEIFNTADEDTPETINRGFAGNANFLNDLNDTAGLIARIRALENVVLNLQNNSKAEIDVLQDKVFNLEKELAKSQQYNRRESVEISGVPENIPQDRLEEYVIYMLRKIGLVDLSHYEIAACHRLKFKKRGEHFRRIIVRFINRKRSYECIQARKNIKFYFPELPKAYIHDSLCFKYSAIYDRCNELKRMGIIKKIWIRNGTIFAKKTDNDYERPVRLYHLDDVETFFPLADGFGGPR